MWDHRPLGREGNTEFVKFDVVTTGTRFCLSIRARACACQSDTHQGTGTSYLPTGHTGDGFGTSQVTKLGRTVMYH